MPGSKRRALKNLLSPSPTPSPNQTPTSPPPIPPQNYTGGSAATAGAIPIPTHGQGAGISPDKTQKSHSHSFSNLFHPNRKSSTSLHPVDSSTSASAVSIGEEPGNYMSDQALDQELVLEEMKEREGLIGSGHGREGDGVGNLFVGSGTGGGGGAVPPPAGIGMGGSQSQGHGQMGSIHNGNISAGAGASGAENMLAAHQDDPTAAKGYTPGTQGGGAAHTGNGNDQVTDVVTAEELMGVDGGDGNGRGKKGSRQRFAERQARKKEALLHSAPPSDPAWTAQLEKERQEEIQVISDACAVLGREIYEIAPDGHCMFNAISDQLYYLGLIPAHQTTNPLTARHTASKYMLDHSDDFLPFLPSVTGEDSVGATDDGMMTEKQFKKYCKNVAETGEWGGEPEIQALSLAFNIPIHVFQRGPPTVVSHGGSDDSFGGGLTPENSASMGDQVVRISYHKRMYGLGEHYNSLRKAV